MGDYWDEESKDEEYVRLNKDRVLREVRELPMSKLTVGDYDVFLNAVHLSSVYHSFSIRDLRNLEELLQKVYDRYGR